MQWYYKDRNDGSRHGIVEEKQLLDMLRKGQLKPSDLVWSDKTGGRWAPASSVEGLLPKEAEAPPATQAQQASTKSGAAPKRHPAAPRGGFRSAVIVVVVVAACAGLAIKHLKQQGGATVSGNEADANSIPDVLPVPDQTTTNTATPQNAVPVDESETSVVVQDGASLVAQFNEALSREDLAKATKLLSDILVSSEDDKTVQSLNRRLSLAKRNLARIKSLESDLRAGRLDLSGCKELVTAYETRNRKKDLLTIVNAVLNNTNALAPEICIGIARTCSIMGEHEQTKAALSGYAARVKFRNNTREYVEIARMFGDEKEPLRGAELLARYLENDDKSSIAWLEYAALKCAGGDDDSALDALRRAVKYGGDNMKDNAAADPRFAPLKEDRDFKKLIRK